MVRSQEGSKPLGGGLADALALAFTFRLRLLLALTRRVRRVGPRSGAIATVSAFAVAFAAARGARGGLGRRGLACSKFAISPAAEGDLSSHGRG